MIIIIIIIITITIIITKFITFIYDYCQFHSVHGPPCQSSSHHDAHPASATPLNRPLLVSVTYPKVPSHRSLVRILPKSSLGYPVCYDVFA